MPMPWTSISDVIAFGAIGTGGNSAGNGGNGGDISGPVVNVPIYTATPINVALGGSAAQTNNFSTDMSQDVYAGDGGNGGNHNDVDGGDVAIVPVHDVAAQLFDDFVNI